MKTLFVLPNSSSNSGVLVRRGSPDVAISFRPGRGEGGLTAISGTSNSLSLVSLASSWFSMMSSWFDSSLSESSIEKKEEIVYSYAQFIGNALCVAYLLESL